MVVESGSVLNSDFNIEFKVRNVPRMLYITEMRFFFTYMFILVNLFFLLLNSGAG